MSFLRRITSLLMLLYIACMAAFTVNAMPMTGSISLRFACDGEAVGGGTVTLYRVGEVAEGTLEYTLCPEFAGSGADLTKLGDPDTAGSLAEYAREQDIPGQTQPVGESGEVQFAILKTGLYLIVQFDSSFGYELIRPFLVGIPLIIGENVYYDIEASQKMAITPLDPAETEPPELTNPRLPQTGQLNWLVSFLALLGLILIILGWMLHFLICHEDDET